MHTCHMHTTHTHIHTYTHIYMYVQTAMSHLKSSALKQITAEKLRDVLTTVGVRITPYHMTELLQRAGVKDGCLVDYKSFMDRFTSRSRDGLAHSLVSDPHKG